MGATLGPILNIYLYSFANGSEIIMMALGGTGVPDFEDLCFGQFPSPSAVHLSVFPVLLVASPSQMLRIVAVSRMAGMERVPLLLGWCPVGCPAGYPVDPHFPAVRSEDSVTGSADSVLP